MSIKIFSQGIQKLLNVFYLFFDGLILAFTSSVESRKPQVLLVRVDAIGDFVLWLDSATVLIDHYRKAGYSVVLMANQAWANWAEDMQIVDEVWEVDVLRFNKKPIYRSKLILRIRNRGFKIAIQPTYSRVFRSGDSMMRASCASERIGSEGDESNITPWFKSLSNRWFTKLIPAENTPLMELKRNAEFMRGLGFIEFKAGLPVIHPVSDALSYSLPKLPYAVLVPSASWYGRAWPSINFIAIAYRLVECGLGIVVVGGAKDHDMARDLVDALPEKVVNLVGKTSLSELVEILRSASVIISNETSSVHIGAAVNAPVVCILGGGHFGRFAPYQVEVSEDHLNLPTIVTEKMNCFGCNWQCHYSRQATDPVKCIQDISVEKVWGAVEKILHK